MRQCADDLRKLPRKPFIQAWGFHAPHVPYIENSNDIQILGI